MIRYQLGNEGDEEPDQILRLGQLVLADTVFYKEVQRWAWRRFGNPTKVWSSKESLSVLTESGWPTRPVAPCDPVIRDCRPGPPLLSHHGPTSPRMPGGHHLTVDSVR